MKKTTRLCFTCLLALTMTLSACTKGNDGVSSSSSGSTSAPGDGTEKPSVSLSGKTAAINLGADPKTLDPGLNSASDGNYVIANTFEGLLRDFGNGPEPAIAEKYEVSEDQLVWTFHLRDGANWSDGKPVTANDFVYSWKRTVDPVLGSEYGYFFKPIKNAQDILDGKADKDALGVEALDEKTLQVTLESPCGYFKELLAFPTLSPVREDVTEPTGLWTKDPAKAVSNGPFYLSEYKLGSHLVLTKNPHYWDAENTKLDNVLMRMIVDASTGLSAFNAGELQWTDKVPTEEIPTLTASGDLQIFPYVSTYYYVISQNTTIEALKDARVRKAISMAIDRQAICNMVTRGGQQPALGLVSPGLPDNEGRDFRETAGGYYLAPTALVDEARALLDEAGYPGGAGIPELELLYNTDEKHKAIAEAVQEMLKTNLGINMRLNNQEWAVFQETRNNGNYPALARHGWTGDYRDPQTFLDMYQTVSGKPNVQSGNQYSNADYDAMVQKGIVSSDQERFDAFYEAERILMEDAYIIPIQYNVNTILSAPEFTGWYLSSIGKLYLGHADITQP